jgi:hypothetical protein
MTSVAEDPSPPPPPRARRRRALWIAASLVAVVLVLVAMLPMLLSTGAGASMIAGMIDDSIAGSVTIDSLSLRWFGGQQVGGLTLLDPEGQPVLTAERAATELSLWRAIRGNLSLGETVIAGVAAQIVRGADGLTNLQRAVESTRPPSDEPARLPPSLHGTVKVEGRANVSGAGIEQPVSMDIQGTFTLAGGGGPISVDLATTARQGDIRGRLTAKGEIHNLAAEDGTLTLLRAVPKLALAGDELPADGLDAMLGLKGRLAAALGETVTAQVHTGGTAEALELGLTLRSPNATADVAALLAGGQSISLTRPAKVTLIATPELLDAMLAPGEDRAALQLVRPVPLDLTAEQVQLTFDDLAASSFIARAVAREPVLFVGDERIGQITAQNLAVNLDSRRLGQAVTFAANVDTIADGQPGKLAVRGELLEVLSSEARRVDVSAQLTNLPSVGRPGRVAARCAGAAAGRLGDSDQ